MASSELAEYTLRGTSEGTDEKKWHEGWLTNPGDKYTAAVEIVDKEGTMVWASEAGDRSAFFGGFKRGGPRKVAGRLANNLKKAVRKY